jgi:hypothetical protein
MAEKVNIGQSESVKSAEVDAIRAKFAHLHKDALDVSAVMKRWSAFMTDASVEAGMQYKVNADRDVIIATHSKAGTTLLQQICHQLRGGDEAFEEISEVVPWFEMAQDAGQDLTAPQPGIDSLRLFKTHFGFAECPKSARYIAVVRDPHDLIVSFYEFLMNWFYVEHEMTLADFVLVMLYNRGCPWWTHTCEWLAAAEENSPDRFLVLFFEDVVQHREAAIQHVAKFLGVTDATCIANAIERSSIEYMREHVTQFDEHLTRQRRDHLFGAVGNVGGSASKVRQGKAGKGEKLGALREEIDAVLAVCMPRVHIRHTAKTYAELRADAFAQPNLNVFRPPQV